MPIARAAHLLREHASKVGCRLTILAEQGWFDFVSRPNL
jgi:hypothetical protein